MDREDWDERYRTEELIWRAEPNRFLVEEAADLPPGRALDLACGEGRNSLWLAERGWRVTAVDFSPVGLGKGRRLAAERGLDVEFVEADVLEWQPPPGLFDLVVVMYLQLPAAGRRRALQRVLGGLAAGGALLVVGHDATNLEHGYGGPKDPAVLFSPDDIVADITAGGADITAGGAGDGTGRRLRVERAERVRRPVSTEEGDFVAIDALVRARFPGPA